MTFIRPRAGHRLLARTAAFVTALTATAILGACSDETTAPAPIALPRAEQADAAAPSPEQVATTVELSILDKRVTFNTSTGYASVRVAGTCSATDTFDVVVEMRQDQKNGAGWSTVVGTATLEDFVCTDGASFFTIGIAPQSGAFVSGNATVTARTANYPEHVLPTEVRRRVRVTT